MVNLPFIKKKEEEKKKEGKKDEKKEVLKKEKILTQKSKIAYRVLKKPMITEKGTSMEGRGKYVFEILNRANKTDIKKAIEDLYNVKVSKVNVINVPRKKRRLGRTQGWKKGYRKAILTLKKGYKIEITPR